MFSSAKVACPQPVDADKAAKHVELANLSLCFDGTIDIGSCCAKNTNIYSRC